MKTIKPLRTGEVYVVIRNPKEWEQYPLPPELVARSTTLFIARSENTSEYALVFYNFSQSPGLVQLMDIHIFDWEARKSGQSGLVPAYEP